MISPRLLLIVALRAAGAAADCDEGYGATLFEEGKTCETQVTNLGTFDTVNECAAAGAAFAAEESKTCDYIMCYTAASLRAETEEVPKEDLCFKGSEAIKDFCDAFDEDEYVVTGNEWTVTIERVDTAEAWTVGAMLLGGGADDGIKRLSYFDEHIGCTDCGAFYAKRQRRGPWILDPPNRLVGAAAGSAAAAHSCVDWALSSPEPGVVDIESGGGYDGPQRWTADEFSYECPDTGAFCALMAAPTVAPTAAPTTASCADSTTWYRGNKKWKTCAWVGKQPAKRCKDTIKSRDGVTASVACPEACDACEPACEDDETWFSKKRSNNCRWVAEKPDSRCSKKSDDKVKAKDACPVACGTCV
ncbi:hypothetical protein SO694_0051500 [Aureococcus anophagefferens]|uniref:Uncharacterized protein n=1 Tax=Aureococcus anophagefferens TaxID=44056 RepID=A0ABR1GED7_AURAN